MIVNDWKWVISAVTSYGIRQPFLDVGGVLETGMRCYDPLLLYVPKSGKHIWSVLTETCEVTHNVQQFSGGPYGTIISTGTLEHVHDLFGFFPAVARLLREDGLCFLIAPFRWFRHGDPHSDFWRFTPDGLELLADKAGLKTLETGVIETDNHRAMSWIICGKQTRNKGPERVINMHELLEVYPE